MAPAGFSLLFISPPKSDPNVQSPPQRGPIVIVEHPRVPKARNEKTKPPQTSQTAVLLLALEAAPSSGPSLFSILDGGPCPPLLPFPLCPRFFSAFLLLAAPRRDSDHLPHLRLAKEGQNRLCRSLIIEEQGSSRAFPPAAFPYFFQSSWIWGFQASQFTKRWWRDCLSSRPHHQHLSDVSLCILLHK